MLVLIPLALALALVLPLVLPLVLRLHLHLRLALQVTGMTPRLTHHLTSCTVWSTRQLPNLNPPPSALSLNLVLQLAQFSAFRRAQIGIL